MTLVVHFVTASRHAHSLSHAAVSRVMTVYPVGGWHMVLSHSRCTVPRPEPFSCDIKFAGVAHTDHEPGSD